MKKTNLWIFMLGLMLLTSCASSKKVLYVKNMEPNIQYPAIEMPPLKLQKNDRVGIVISARNPELAAPFNAIGGSYIAENSMTRNNAAGNNLDQTSYLVDQNGTITFPVLGTLNIVGLTLEEVRTLLAKRLVEGGYINDPTIKVEILNLKVNVMGEVKSGGIIQVPDGRINLLEAISKAGGLTHNAAANRVTVIREENGIRKKVINDIESRDVFDSPTFCLQQNDIVYVEPIAAEYSPREDRTWRLVSIGSGLVTLLLTVLNIVK